MSGQHAVDMRHYVTAVARRVWLVLLIMAVAVGVTYWRLGGAAPTYTAQTTLMVTAPVLTPSSAIPDSTFQQVFQPGQSVVTNDIIALLTSQTIGERVARRLRLPGPHSVLAAVNAVPVRETSLIRVYAASSDPKTAARIANVTADEGIEFFREANRASVAESRRFVEDQLSQVRSKLSVAERAIQSFKERNAVPSTVEALSSQALTQVLSGQTALEDQMVLRREVETRLAAARAQLSGEKPSVVASRTTTESPVYQRIQARLVDLEMQRIEQGQVYTPQHPRMIQIAREIADLKGRLQTETRRSLSDEVTSSNPVHAELLRSIAQLEVDLAAGTARTDAMQALQGRRRATMMSLPARETAFARLMREMRALESTYTMLSNSHQQLVLRENQAGFFPAGLTIIEDARPPVTATATSSFPRTAAAAGFVGLLLGVAAALFLETLDDRVRTPQDAELVLGVPVLAEIPAQGQVRAAPATAIFSITLIFIITTAMAIAIARGHLSVTAGAQEIRSVVTSIVPWGR